MTTSSIPGPLIVYGQNPAQAGTNYQPDYNQDLGPSGFGVGTFLIDPRYGSRSGLAYNRVQATGFFEQQAFLVIDTVPAALGGADIAALANAVSGTAMTLASATAGSVTVSSAALRFLASGTTLAAGTLFVGNVPAVIAFGQSGAVSLYDPRTMMARAVSVTGVSGGAGGAFTVRGYDVYGFAMTETITATSGATTVNGKKAFKAIASVTPGFSDAHNYSIGTTDIIGFPIATFALGNLSIVFNNAIVTATTGFVVADTTTVSATTGDVRGTYALQTPSNGTLRLQMQVLVSPWNAAAANGAASLFGLSQFGG